MTSVTPPALVLPSAPAQRLRRQHCGTFLAPATNADAIEAARAVAPREERVRTACLTSYSRKPPSLAVALTLRLYLPPHPPCPLHPHLPLYYPWDWPGSPKGSSG